MNLTNKNIPDLFKKAKLIDKDFLNCAKQNIIKEIEKRIRGRKNNLIEIAEYINENIENANSHHLLQTCQFAAQVFSFEKRYSDAWNLLVKVPNAAFGDYRAYRQVLKNITIPAKALRELPKRVSRHWSSSELIELHETMDLLLERFKTNFGYSIFEYYNWIEEQIYANIERESGIKLISLLQWKFIPASWRAIEERRRLKDTISKFQEIFIDQINIYSNKFAHIYPDQEKFEKEKARYVKSHLSKWQIGLFWKHCNFLEHYVAGCRFNSKWQISDFYKRGHSLHYPWPIGLIDSALLENLDVLWREAENILRFRKNIPQIGKGWVSESKLVSQVRASFPNLQVVPQASPAWLGRMRFDIYLPQLNLAIEYQGEQHYEPITRFGGALGLMTTQSRDKLKKQLATSNGCEIIYVNPDYNIDNIIQRIQTYQTSKKLGTRVNNPLRKVSSNEGTEILRITSQIITDKLEKKLFALGKATLRKQQAKDKQATGPRLGALGEHNLNECARYGTAGLIKSLHEKGVKFIYQKNSHSDSPLYIAAAAKNIEVLEALIDIGVDVNAENCSRHATALARLCNGRDYKGCDVPPLDSVELLLKAGADVTKHAIGFDIFGNNAYAPPMIGAAISHNLPLAKLLLKYGASVNIKDDYSHTPFIAACGRKIASEIDPSQRLKMINWLYNNGADVLSRTIRNETAFDIATEINREDNYDFSLFNFLMKLNVPLNIKHAFLITHAYELNPTKELKQIIDYGNAFKKQYEVWENQMTLDERRAQHLLMQKRMQKQQEQRAKRWIR